MNKIIKKWKQLPQSAKASIAFIFSSFFLKGISFITTPIFTRLLDTTQYGIIATYNSWISIIEIFAILGLTSAGVFNVGLNEHKENRNKYISTCLGLCNISTLFTFFIIVLLKVAFGNAFLIDNQLLVIMFIHFLFSPAQIFWITRQRYEFKYRFATIVTVLSVLIGQILSIIGIILFKNNGSLYKILGNEIGTLIFAIPIYFLILKKGKDYINIKEWKRILVFAIPLIPHYLSQHIMASSDRIMISNMVCTADTGIYNVVASIGMIANIFWSAINSSLVPYSFEKLNRKDYKSINHISVILLLLYLVVCITIILIAPEVLKFLAPAEYYSGIYVVPPLTTVVFLQALYNLYANIEFYYKKSTRIAIATVIATIINLGLNFIFIPKYSYIAAAYTTLVSYIILVLIHYYNYKKCISLKIYDDKKNLLMTIILLIISLVSNLLYRNNMIRYFSIIAILAIVFIKRKDIISIYRVITNSKKSEKVN